VSTMISVVSIMTGLFLLLVYQFMFVSLLDPMIAQILGSHDFKHIQGEQLANELFGISTGTVVWMSAAALILIGLVNEYRRRRTVRRQRI